MAPFVSESVGELDQMIDWKDLSNGELIHESDITPSLWPFMNMQNKQLLACSSQKKNYHMSSEYLEYSAYSVKIPFFGAWQLQSLFTFVTWKSVSWKCIYL